MWRGVPSEGHRHSAPTRRTHGWGGHGGSRGGRRPEGAGGEAARSSRRPAVRQECGEHDGGALRLALTRGTCLAAVAAAGDGECAAGGGPGVAAPWGSTQVKTQLGNKRLLCPLFLKVSPDDEMWKSPRRLSLGSRSKLAATQLGVEKFRGILSFQEVSGLEQGRVG